MWLSPRESLCYATDRIVVLRTESGNRRRMWSQSSVCPVQHHAPSPKLHQTPPHYWKSRGFLKCHFLQSRLGWYWAPMSHKAPCHPSRDRSCQQLPSLPPIISTCILAGSKPFHQFHQFPSHIPPLPPSITPHHHPPPLLPPPHLQQRQFLQSSDSQLEHSSTFLAPQACALRMARAHIDW